MPAHAKLVGLVLFVLAVVSVPSTQSWVLAGLLGISATVLLATGVAWRHLLPRLAVETPFIVFALLLPFVATGPTVTVLGPALVGVRRPGAWNVLAKGTLGVVAAVLLSATTAPPTCSPGSSGCGCRRPLVAILSFMVRYLSVVSDDLHRMRIARESRGYTGGRVGHLKAVAGGVGALFVRSFERGERVHLAMRSRGYTGPDAVV